MCGKMAAGKTTLSATLKEAHSAILLSEDELLTDLYYEDINDFESYLKCSGKLKAAISAHICQLLLNGVSVVLDFPGNTRNQRKWFRELIDSSNAPHELHFLDVPDEVCKAQLKKRTLESDGKGKMQTEETLDFLARYFDPPSPEEKFVVVKHSREI